MRIFTLPDMNEQFPNPVLTIGNYDGIHVGHQKIIEQVVEKARTQSGTAMLMTFDPHPLSILKPDTYTRLITPLHLKKQLVEKCGIDVMFVVPFDDAFKGIAPEAFIKEILVKALGVKGIIVGYDFTFGKGGTGNVGLLKQMGKEYGFSFEAVPAILMDGEKIGSNKIRKLIMNGEVERAARFLGRPHMIEGVVVRGENRGKGMGFPTINLDTFAELVPKNGVYVTEVEVEGKRMPSVTNIGFNPTFGGKKFLMETHILDFSRDLYDQEVIIYFHDHLRDEMKFKSIDELKKRITEDVALAQEHFKRIGYRRHL
jgi:riboflavin kinase/FMN adenylyltransferase